MTMTHAELLSGAEKVHPDRFQKMAQALQLAERLEPEFAKEASADISDILDFAHEQMEAYDTKVKTAAHGGGGLGGHAYSTIGSAARAIGTGIGAGIGASLLSSISSDIYDAARRGLTKSRNYKRIVKENPELEQKYDKADLKKAFTTLHRYAPEFTADPSLGGQLLSALASTASTMGGFATVKELINSRKSLIEAKERRFQPRFEFHSSKDMNQSESYQPEGGDRSSKSDIKRTVSIKAGG
jgi:hypothetical protein